MTLIDVTKLYRLSLFKKKIGVENLTLSAEPGQVLGILGPNGSGKSTTFKLLMGFLKPSAGNILLFGEPACTASRQQVGYLPENPRFPHFFNASQALRFYGHLLGLDGTPLENKISELLELVGLSASRNERIKGFSKGMGQRLAIAQSLLNDPKLLVFDEPMSGLDPIGRIEVRELIHRIHRRMPEATILMSTHILSDAENLCTHVALLQKGRLEKYGAMNEVLRSPTQHFEVTIRGVAGKNQAAWLQEWGAEICPMGLQLKVASAQELERCLHAAAESGDEVVEVHSEKLSLERALFAREAVR